MSEATDQFARAISISREPIRTEPMVSAIVHIHPVALGIRGVGLIMELGRIQIPRLHLRCAARYVGRINKFDFPHREFDD